MTVKVVIPAHGCSCDGEIKVATGKEKFKCPECGKMFSIKENKYVKPIPECIHSNGIYTCSISNKELTLDSQRGEIVCGNNDCKCDCSYGMGIVFEDIIQAAHVPGFYNDSGLVNQGNQHSRMKSIPARMLQTLGLKGAKFIEDSTIIHGKPYQYNYIEFDFEGETRIAKPLGNGLYDIGHERFLLFHRYERIIELRENEPDNKIVDKEKTHLFALIDKNSKRMYIIPKNTKKIFGFSFSSNKLYGYYPQKGYSLSDAQAFKDNTRFLAYKVKEIFENPKTNKRETIFGYLVEEGKTDTFLTLMKRSTRIFSNVDYSGVPQHQKMTVWNLRNQKTYKNILEVMEEDRIYDDYQELIKRVPHSQLECDITQFENIDLDEIRQDLANPKPIIEFFHIEMNDLHMRVFQPESISEYIIHEEKIEFTDEEFEDIKTLYENVDNFINEYCQKFCGNVEYILWRIYCDSSEDDNEKFTRFIEEFDGGRDNAEYYSYSNRDLINACKVQHDLRLVTISDKNEKALNELFEIGKTHLSYNPWKSGKAQDIAFEYESEYENLGQLIKEDKAINTIKIFGDKPREEWSEKDYERFTQGQDVKEIKRIIIGANVSKQDPISRHCLYKEPLPEGYNDIAVSGSRVLPPAIRTKRSGYEYFSPAISIWKGYFIKNNVNVLFARVAKGSDSAALIAAIEVNEYLANQCIKGEITPEEYDNQRIKIVAILHSWYASADFNNHGLTSILDRVLEYGGYVFCNEPYRSKRETEHIRLEDFSYYDEDVDRIDLIKGSGIKFTWFDRRIERTNKLLVNLASKLVVLCRSTYSGTTNTRNFALDEKKEVIDLSSPDLEPIRDIRAESDPIKKGHSISTLSNISIIDVQDDDIKDCPINRHYQNPLYNYQKDDYKCDRIQYEEQ